MRRSLLSSLLALPVALACTGAYAASQDFALVNRTGYQIDEVYVSPVNNNRWGSDVMGRDSLGNGQTVNISFNARSNVCSWDLRVKYNDGDEATWRNLNLCSIRRITLFWDRRNQTTRATTE